MQVELQVALIYPLFHITAPKINIILGNKNLGIELERSWTKNAAVPNSLITELNDQASINITPVIRRPFIPSTHASIASETVNIFLKTAMTIATTEANNADWNNATEASELLKAWRIASNDAGEFVIIAWSAVSSPAIIAVYPL